MSYEYYKEELNRVRTAPNPDGYGLSVQIRANDTGVSTKWLSLTDECREALMAFLIDTSQKSHHK